MAQEPGVGSRITATFVQVKGHCSAGHRAGETCEISVHNTAGLCGSFYHAIFPSLALLQFGGKYPWWEGDTVFVQCPDPVNTVTLKLERSDR